METLRHLLPAGARQTPQIVAGSCPAYVEVEVTLRGRERVVTVQPIIQRHLVNLADSECSLIFQSIT